MSERRPIPFPRFGGWRLDLPMDEVGPDEATWLCDVDWNDEAMGTLRVRDAAKAIGAESAEENTAIIPHESHEQPRLIVFRGKKLLAIKNTGTVAQEFTYEAVEFIRGTSFSSPSAHYTYICGGGKAMVRYDDTGGAGAFTEPKATVDGVAAKAMPQPQFVIVWPDGGNRLVAIGSRKNGKFGPGEAEMNTSYVWFSDPGEPQTWHTVAPQANYLQLSPGDTEPFTGACVWNGKLFIFKRSKMFIVYSVSTNEEGAPVFNYLTVDLGTEIAAPQIDSAGLSDSICSAGKEAVYFVSYDGVYATTGGTPTCISDKLSKLGRFKGQIIGPAKTAIEEYSEPTPHFENYVGLIALGTRLYVYGETWMLIYDSDVNAWLLWAVGINSMCAWTGSGFSTEVKRLYFTGSEKKNVFLFEGGTPGTDPNVTVKPTWQSGYYDLETQDEKSLVESKLWGTGEITLKLYKDFSLEPSSSKVVKLTGTVGHGRERTAQTATLFSHRIELAQGANLQRLVRYIREAEVAGGKTGTK